MKFSSFREFRVLPRGVSGDDVIRYLSIDLARVLQELRAGLERLTLRDNFESFEATITIPAASELAIANLLKGGVIPSKWIVVDTDEAGLSVCRGESSWTKDLLYLKNTHATDPATLTVVFLR